ncbi:MAG TPA: hypothetical protein PK110_10910 [Niabella sp.]|nr:hypothetical protein [Chitinophagaceae bacterium]HRO85323.1 hypothetical protein [Niabella sp.]
MIPEIRKSFNEKFLNENYEAFIKEMDSRHGEISFRIAETPVFVPKSFSNQMIDACESIVDIIKSPSFKTLTEKAVPENLVVPNENDYPHCIAFDFGVCKNEKGALEPQLIEMQGFPSMFSYEIMLEEVYRNHFEIPDGFAGYIGGYHKESYIQLLKDVIVGDLNPENVILLEIFPEKQKTKIDFYCSEYYLGIKPVCVTTLIKKGKQLFYEKDGKEVLIKRIYNRLIFDELLQQEPEVQEKAKILFEELDVEWIPHPAWFYRISKYTLPLIDHPNIPKTYYLNKLEEIPADLENYVLKPLFSFAGQGVVIDVTPADIEKITDPENWILQRKVNYAAVIDTPDEPAKAEIRIFYFWKKGEDRPKPANNLARLSKGKMIGVRYNKDKTWTGGSFGLIEQ